MKAALINNLKFAAVVAAIISLGLWVQSDQFKLILGVGLKVVLLLIAVVLFVILAWAASKKNETVIFFLASAACGVLVSIYHDSNGFRDLPWHEWLLIGWCLIALADAAQLIIANGVAAGIAKAKAQEKDKLQKEQAKGATP